MGMSAEEPEEEERRRQQEQEAQEAARQAEIDAIVSRMQELIRQWEQNGNQINEVTTFDELPQNTREQLIAAGLVLTAAPEGVSTVIGLGMIATGGFLILWDKFVYDKDGKLDVSKLHYTYQPPFLNPIHNQPRKPEFNPGDYERIVKWGGGILLGAKGIQNLYKTTQVELPINQTPVNQPDKTRVARPQFYFNPANP